MTAPFCPAGQPLHEGGERDEDEAIEAYPGARRELHDAGWVVVLEHHCAMPHHQGRSHFAISASFERCT
ncbi:MAG: hypothetical protein SFW67_10305 [Myxococcaceae bacterium]|nr:hypothetical protein [Myxococcaceae bacterium]